MSTPIFTTRFYTSLTRPKFVFRPAQSRRLNAALQRTPGGVLVSTAGVGKTIVVTGQSNRPAQCGTLAAELGDGCAPHPSSRGARR